MPRFPSLRNVPCGSATPRFGCNVSSKSLLSSKEALISRFCAKLLLKNNHFQKVSFRSLAPVERNKPGNSWQLTGLGSQSNKLNASRTPVLPVLFWPIIRLTRLSGSSFRSRKPRKFLMCTLFNIFLWLILKVQKRFANSNGKETFLRPLCLQTQAGGFYNLQTQ